MPQSNSGSPITVTIKGSVATVSLCRPEKLNAINVEMLDALRQAMEDCWRNDDVRAILITGSGKGFCAGQDLSERDPRKVQFPLDLEDIQRRHYHPAIRSIAENPKPIVIAINGLAAGAGVSLALSGDIVIAAKSAKLLFSFIKIGLSVDAGLGWLLTRTLGPARTRGLLLTAASLTASEATELGLIFRCVEDEELEAEALAIATMLATGPKTAISSIKQAVRIADTCDHFADYLLEEAWLQGAAGQSPDYAEGALAFHEKRAPKFGG